MAKRWFAGMFFVMVIGAAPTFLSSIPAAAAPGPTPNGSVGACNMIFSGASTGAGMIHAMSVDNANGNLGMSQAVAVTGGGCG